MKKYRVLSIALITLLALLIPTTSVLATTTQGLTPGFWKQPHHFVAARGNPGWDNTGFSPGDRFSVAANTLDMVDSSDDFPPVEDDMDDPTLTLLECLKLKGGGENAFLRHAAAAILNSTCGINYASEEYVAKWIWFAYNNDAPAAPYWDTFTMEEVKDHLEEMNEKGL